MKEILILKCYVKKNNITIEDLITIKKYNLHFNNYLSGVLFLKEESIFNKSYKPFFDERGYNCIMLNNIKIDIQGVYMIFEESNSLFKIFNNMFKDFNIYTQEVKWYMEQEQIYNNNINLITKTNLKKEYPSLYKITKGNIGFYCILNLIGLDKITVSDKSYNNSNCFQCSRTYLMKLWEDKYSFFLKTLNKKKAGYLIDSYCLLGLIRKVNYQDLPGILQDENDKQKQINISTYLIIPELNNKILREAERVAFYMLENNLTISKINTITIKDKFSDDIYNNLYGDNELNNYKVKKVLKKKKKEKEIQDTFDKEQSDIFSCLL